MLILSSYNEYDYYLCYDDKSYIIIMLSSICEYEQEIILVIDFVIKSQT